MEKKGKIHCLPFLGFAVLRQLQVWLGLGVQGTISIISYLLPLFSFLLAYHLILCLPYCSKDGFQAPC